MYFHALNLCLQLYCDKKINIVDICTITVALYLSVVKVIASFCILYCILSTVHW